MAKNLLDLTEDEMEKIVDYVDFKDIFTLRKVCHDLRNFIDDKKPDIGLSYVLIRVGPSAITAYWHCRDFFSGVQYEQRSWSSAGEPVSESVIYQERFFADLAVILSHQKSLLPMLNVTIGILEKETDEFYEKLGKILQSVPQKVRKLELQVRNHAQILQILPFLDQESLKSIVFSNVANAERPIFELTEIRELEQWKRAEELEMHTISMGPGTKLKDFMHFSDILINLERITIEELLSVKETFLTSSKHVSYRISFINLENREQFVAQLGEPSDTLPEYELLEWWLRTNDERRKLRIVLRPTVITFRRAEMIPE